MLGPRGICAMSWKKSALPATDVILTDRGTSFGYNNLVTRCAASRSCSSWFSVCFDASHSVQLPGGQGTSSGGQREFILPLTRAAIAAGANCLFIESHPDPAHAKSDKDSVYPFTELPGLLEQIVADLRDRTKILIIYILGFSDVSAHDPLYPCLSYPRIRSLGAALLYVRPRDIEHAAVCKSRTKSYLPRASISTTHQQRKNVKKEIYFVQEDNSRLHYRIYSESSLLTMQPQTEGKKIELNEKLEKIKCWMQDKLYYSSPGTGPMQQIRFLEAEEGVYCYTSQQFLAQAVALSLFRLPDHDLPKDIRATPFLKGVAQDVSICCLREDAQF